MANQSKFYKYKWPIIAIIAVISIIYAGQTLLGSSETSTQTQTTNTTATVKRGKLTAAISTTGQIQTANFLAITTSVNGVVKKVYVKEGDKVIKGQKIMDITLDTEGEKSRINALASFKRSQDSLNEARNRLIALEAAVRTKEKTFNDIKETTNYQGDEEVYQFHNAESEFLSAKASLADQKNSISQLQLSVTTASMDLQTQSPTIIAPDSGIISNITAVEGTKIENSVTSDRSIKTVASIKQEGTPIASLDITELDISKIKVGQKVNMTLSSAQNQTFSGSVVGIDRIGTVSSGVSNYPVIIKFDQDSEVVFPNMGVNADIVTEEKSDVLYVPTASIKTQNGQKVVEVINGQESITVEVEIGISDAENTEIKSGLNENDEVVIQALPTSGFNGTTTQNNRTGGNRTIIGGFGGFGR